MDEEAKKKKCGLMIGYVGTNYHGSEFGTKTSIGSELFRAMSETGFVRPENATDPKKIRWSASSRTDKGVHSVATLIAAKLELTPQESSMNPLDLDTHVRNKLNMVLPNDIRVLQCTRVSRGYHARSKIDMRQYEYLIPLDSLPEGEKSIPNLNHLLQQFVGINSIHNFTKGQESPSDAYVRTIYMIKPEVVDIYGRRFVRVTLLGASFVYHQIRKTLGTALAILYGLLPEDYIYVALNSEEYVPTPLAPSQTLILRECVMEEQNDRNILEQRREEFLLNSIYPSVLQLVNQDQGLFKNFKEKYMVGFMEAYNENIRDKYDHIKERTYLSVKTREQRRLESMNKRRSRLTKDLDTLTSLYNEGDKVKLNEFKSNVRIEINDLLPNGFYTDLVIRYNLYRDEKTIEDVIIVLVSEMYAKRLDLLHPDKNYYFNYIDKHGLEKVASRGKYLNSKANSLPWKIQNLQHR